MYGYFYSTFKKIMNAVAIFDHKINSKFDLEYLQYTNFS